MDALKRLIDKDTHVKQVMDNRGRRTIYLVGGTVRDAVLGIPPKDYDFAVSGAGITFARRFARVLHGAFVLLSKRDDEARVVKDDIIYDFIGFGKDPVENDLARRDFTMNAVAVELISGDIIDPHHGLRDIQKGVVRPIDKTSLSLDPLRVLRGFRFALELDFTLHKEFFRYAKGITLSGVAAERIGYELMRIMAEPDSFGAIISINDLDLFPQVFPEARKIIEDGYLWEHSRNTYRALEALMEQGFFTGIQPEFEHYFDLPRHRALLKLAGLLHDVAKPHTFLLKDGEVHFYGHDVKGAKIVQVLGYERMKLPRTDVQVLRALVKEHMRLHLLATSQELTDRAIRRFFRDLGDEWFGAMMLAWADGFATAGWTRHLETVFQRMVALKREDDAKPKIERFVNGYDLIAMGLKPGPKFKIILQELLDMQLEGKIQNKEEGLQAAKEIASNLQQ
ncbi:MAG: CCA tRNA nucleotidyltransferase [candidate division WOR-3 bacterium]|nr:MAG: CCA tRNA nucleotidyltransferase [candidate division WOR-3 bacterium]